MRFLDKKLGPFRIRGWGLTLNMIANAIGLYGLARVIQDGSGYAYLITGALLTVLFIAVLAIPAADD